MQGTLTLEAKGQNLTWHFSDMKAIDKLVSALIENEPEWQSILISIQPKPEAH